MANKNVISMMAFRALNSMLQTRSALATLAGKTFGGNRDLYATLGYKRALLYSDYFDRYQRGGIAKRIVSAKPSATWRRTPVIHEAGEPVLERSENETEFSKAWDELQNRLRVTQMLQRLDRVSGIGEYGLLLVGTRGARGLASPMRDLRGPEDILYLSVFSQEHADIDELVTSTVDPRYGLPLYYKLALATTSDSSFKNKSASNRTVKVHHSHVIHVAEGLDENNIYGIPKLKPVWNYLDDLEKVAGGSAEAYWLIAHRGMQANIPSDSILDPDDETALETEMQEYYDGMRRFIKTQGVELTPFQSETTDPRGVFQILISLIAGETNIPQRILIGSERGQLASSQDAHSWNELILERQENHAEPNILRPFVNMLMNVKALPRIEPYFVTWPALTYQTENEKAEMAARAAQAANNIAKHMTLMAQVSETPIITAKEFREKFLGLSGEAEKMKLKPKEKEPEKLKEIVQPPKAAPPKAAPPEKE